MRRITLFLWLCLFIFSIASAKSELLNSLVNETNALLNETNQTVLSNLLLVGEIIPSQFVLGDSWFTIKITNPSLLNRNNVLATLSGAGFATYEVTPINVLTPNGVGYLLVHGVFSKPGIISLKILLEGVTYTTNITVLAAEPLPDNQNKENQQTALIALLTQKLSDIKLNYSMLEDLRTQKEDDGFDVSKVNLNDLRTYILKADSALVISDTTSAQLNLKLAQDEYAHISLIIATVRPISILSKIKDNAIVFSTIVGAILAFFTLYELLKRKSEPLVNKVGGAARNITLKKK